MAAVRAQEASSSASRFAYHVLLSRGEDTRWTFADHLYTALVGAGFHTFGDNKDEIKRGENIKLEFQRAINVSKSSIVVFSKDYVSSGWCLEELVMILEQKRTSKHVILPVFYDIEPSQVRKQTGIVAEAFSRHKAQFEAESSDERRKEYELDRMEKWRAALREVADLAGMVLQNQADGYESKFIQIIVEEIARKLDPRVLRVTPYPIGLESRVKDINLWLQDGSNNVGMTVICGMGGIGKTTIAKTLYNQNFYRFEGSSFLADIRETAKQFNGLVRLQKKLLLDIYKGKKEKIRSVDEGIIKIKYAISCRRVLLVLDDVDDLGQVNAIFGMQDWFHSGSKIIITTRNERLLKAHEVCEMYKVMKFDDDEALHLFSWHAFQQDHPIEAYMELSKRIVHHCEGLPLALEVLGSYLCGEKVDIWESALAKLGSCFEKKIQNVLQISYDSLDDHDKNLFLDIACFFVGRDKDFVVKILDDQCDFHTTVGIQNLIHRCLVTISGDDNKLMMHQLLRDMGREMIRRESPKEPGKRSRVWRHKDAYNVLREKTATATIEGLILDLHNMPSDELNTVQHHFEDFVDESTLIGDGNSMKKRRLSLFSWLPINSALAESFLESDEADLQMDAFSRMCKLRILQLCNVRLTGCYEEFPKKLRWLCWHGFSLKFIPHDFPLENLVVLDMRNSSLGQLWKGTKMLRLLKILNLSHSHALANSPDFSQLPNLEKLVLKDCINLVGLHESIGKLGRLILLNLRGCENLRKLPREIVQLNSLEELILSDCSRLDKLPPDLGRMESLKVLEANGINQLCPTTGGDLKPWHELFRSWVLGQFLVSSLQSSPKSICFSLTSLPRSLVRLTLASCNLSSDGIPGDLGNLSLLKRLDLSGNPICSLPGNVKGLSRLNHLSLSNCTRLQSLPELPMSVGQLALICCRSLKVVSNLPNHLDLDLFMRHCDKLVEVKGLWKLEPVGNIDSEMVNNLGLAELDTMGMIEVGLWNTQTLTSKKARGLQALYECGIYSIFLPGSETPKWFNLKSRGESSIPFTIPSLPNLKIRGLNVGVVFAYASNWRNVKLSYECIEFSNKTKDLKWIYKPIINVLWIENKDMIWLSDWKLANPLMEGGDEVNVSVTMLEKFQVKEFGIRILYDKEEEKGTNNYTNYHSCHQNAIDFSVYQICEGRYFLCNETNSSTREEIYSSIQSGWDSPIARGHIDGEKGEYLQQ